MFIGHYNDIHTVNVTISELKGGNVDLWVALHGGVKRW